MKARNINLQATQMTGMICTVQCNKFVAARKRKSYATIFVTTNKNENENGCGTFFHIKGWYIIVTFDYCVSVVLWMSVDKGMLESNHSHEYYYLVKYCISASACQRNKFIFWKWNFPILVYFSYDKLWAFFMIGFEFWFCSCMNRFNNNYLLLDVETWNRVTV